MYFVRFSSLRTTVGNWLSTVSKRDSFVKEMKVNLITFLLDGDVISTASEFAWWVD